MRKFWLLDYTEDVFRSVSETHYVDTITTMFYSPNGIDIVTISDTRFETHRVDIYQNDILVGFSYIEEEV